jgi:hypothetical protein
VYAKRNPKDKLGLRFKKALKDERRQQRRPVQTVCPRPVGTTVRRPRVRRARPRRRTSPARAGPSDGPPPPLGPRRLHDSAWAPTKGGSHGG